VKMRIRSVNGGSIIVSAGRPWEERLGTYEAIAPGRDSDWQLIEFNTENITGVHALWIQCYGGEGDLFEIDWLEFH